MLGQVDRPHAALAQFADDFVVSDGLADHISSVT
jgi:hypothetical protein